MTISHRTKCLIMNSYLFYNWNCTYELNSGTDGKKQTSGNAASIRQRLLNLSRERNENFDFVLKQFVIQRLLYRLSVSNYRDQFLLKGAMLFLVWTGELHRPTKDIDLLGFGPNDVAALESKFKTICYLDTHDGLLFDIDSINGTQIKESELYQGVRLAGFAYLDKAKVSFQVDIGLSGLVML